MSFDLFVELATELKIQIIKKVNSHRVNLLQRTVYSVIPFLMFVSVNLAALWMNCEADRKQLGV